MKRITYILLFLVLFTPCIIFGSEKDLNIYLFYGDGCPHCAEEEEWFKTYLDKNKNIKVHRYEVWYNKDNQEKYSKVHEILNDKSSGIPYLIIGETVISGFDKELTPERIKNAVEYYSNINYKDKVGIYLGVVSERESGKDEAKYEDTKVKIPLLGTKEAKDVSIGLSAILIGVVDGFNPCAMWVLLFLISMLIGMKNRKRMWILGLSFLLISALVYMAIMLSWINLVVNVATSIVFRNVIAVIAIIGAIINLNGFRKSQSSGCEIVDDKKRKKIFTKIKKFTTEKSFVLALLGVIGLAISVNVIELACSAGLPIVYTQILALNNITGFKAFLYTLVYIFFFLIDDIIVFVIAMVTTKVTGISTKYNKYSHLIGGIIMLLIGILLIFKPEWLMFNFG